MELKEKRTAVLEHSVQYICGPCEKKKTPRPFRVTAGKPRRKRTSVCGSKDKQKNDELTVQVEDYGLPRSRGPGSVGGKETNHNWG
jgi:hypothetical protein